MRKVLFLKKVLQLIESHRKELKPQCLKYDKELNIHDIVILLIDQNKLPSPEKKM